MRPKVRSTFNCACYDSDFEDFDFDRNSSRNLKIIQSLNIVSNKKHESEERKGQEREGERKSKSEEYVETVYF